MLASLTVPFYVSPFPLLLVQLVSGTVVLPSFPLCAISFTGFHLLLCWFFLYHSWLLWTRIAFLWDRGRFPVPERRSFRPTSPAKTNKQKKAHTPTNQTGDALPVQAILMPCSACLLFAESEQHSEILPFCLVGVIHAG